LRAIAAAPSAFVHSDVSVRVIVITQGVVRIENTLVAQYPLRARICARGSFGTVTFSACQPDAGTPVGVKYST
jgi:hypothetical protein